jgi:hypothetical protein
VGCISQARRGHTSQGRLQPLNAGPYSCKEDCTIRFWKGCTAGNAQNSRHRFIGALYCWEVHTVCSREGYCCAHKSRFSCCWRRLYSYGHIAEIWAQISRQKVVW